MGDRLRAPLTSVVLVGAFLAASLSAYGLSVPVESGFRMRIALGDPIVVGRVVSTDPHALTGLRTSRVAVEHVLWGRAAPGETLRVRWHAKTWDAGGGVSGEVSGNPPQLDDMMGMRVLWFLSFREGSTLTGPPVVLESISSNEITSLLTLILDPDEEDLLAGALVREGLPEDVREELNLAPQKLDIVEAYLSGYLDGLVAGGAGRSN